jgi:hypothetical protein
MDRKESRARIARALDEQINPVSQSFPLLSANVSLCSACPMLWPNDVKEELSLAYVHAVASRAGFAVETIHKDRDSVDLKIMARGKLDSNATLESPEVAVQLKATQRDIGTGEPLHFDLPAGNYEDLIKRTLVPRVLIVFFLPEDIGQWVTVSEHSLTMRRSAFWMSLLGQPPSSNKTTQRVHLPEAQGFSPEALRDLLARIGRQEDL